MLHELNRVIDYIEDHLTDDLTLESISEYAGVSDYHFRKIFFYISGMTLGEYVKNRRLSEATRDLLRGDRVTDVAFRYGYESLDGFTRAFKRWCGFLPSDVVKTGVSKSFPKLSFIISVKGGVAMEFKIVEKPAFNLVGVSGRVPMQFEGVNDGIVKLANSITEDQRVEMRRIRNVEPLEIISASYDADENFLKEEGDLTHLIGVLTTEKEVGEGLSVIPVEACTWAVFPNEGPFPETLQNTMAEIYAQWLPVSGYEVLPLPTFSFTRMDAEKIGHAYSEIWTPVKKI